MEEYARQDLAFHRLIVEATGNEVLLENWDALHFDIRTRLFLGQSKPSLHSNLDLHDEIVKALIEGNRRLTVRLLRRHWEAFCSSGEKEQEGIPDS